MSFLSEKGKQSSMRIAFLGITISVVLLLSSLTALILSSIWLDTELEWMGMAALIGATTTPLGAMAGAKAYQKKYEPSKDE